MIIIPFALNSREYSVFVALDDTGIDRITKYDPAEVDFNTLPYQFRNKRLSKVIVGYATAEDIQHVLKLSAEGKIGEGLEYLSRGFAFRPNLGDYEGPPLSLKTEDGETKQ